MKPFRILEGIAVPILLPNIDTDQIIPKQFLKTVERTGLGRGLFYDLRLGPDGDEDVGFILNQQPWRNAKILIAGDNFGCGSSREHAPWALLDFGIRCVVAPSFAEIFSANCFNNGLLPVTLTGAQVTELATEARDDAGPFRIDLPSQQVTSSSGRHYRFEIDPIRKRKLLEGRDAISETLRFQQEIEAFEARLELQELSH